MVRSPQEILDRLVETALQLCRAGSSGISIIEADGSAGIFRWHALVGALAEHRWETTPRDFSPCGTVVDTNATQLMSKVYQHFTYFAAVEPLITEALLVPFNGANGPIGTIWVVMHDEDRHFDAEDARLLENLGEFAAAAYEVRSALEKSHELDRRKDAFLATLAHELRNPLSVLQSAGYFIAKRLEGPEDAALKRIADVHRRQLAAMTRMIDDLMDVSRINRDKMELRCEPVDLSRVIRDAVEMSQPLISKGAHHLAVELKVQPCWISGDAVRLVQIISNLLNNAAKFAPPEGRIFLSLDCEGDRAVIRVRDEGIGIAAPMLARIFEPFEQIEEGRGRAQGGLGIGLSLVKRLTEMHGGTVQAHSAGPGRGSEFTVRLPGVFPTAAVPDAVPSEPLAGTGKQLRILIVDDNRDSADSIAVLLAGAGHEVRVCYDGPSALTRAAEFMPHVLLQDIGMPHMDGREIAGRIRALPATRDIRLIALSGYGQDEDVQRSLDAGFAHHLVKPVDIDRLLSLIDAEAGGSEALSS